MLLSTKIPAIRLMMSMAFLRNVRPVITKHAGMMLYLIIYSEVDLNSEVHITIFYVINVM
ncbi:MAG: hypothetical protein D6732_02635 [Methanobacteriota archaeon]|nr:MAG: hypothetical protein D6732_02635 [Euryarchaeota archaeon]